MSFLVGSVGSLGHPFCVTAEVPIERRIGEHTVYAYDVRWLYSKLEIVPVDLEAIVVWDPGWCRDGTTPGAIDEIGKLRGMAREWDVPIFGLASDWFATWGVGGSGMYGMASAYHALDGVVIDSMGAATLREAFPARGAIDPDDYRYREIVELAPFLHCGRLPTIGSGEPFNVSPPEARSIDVSMISSLYPGLVIARSYFVEAAREICRRNGWSFIQRARVTPTEMERIYLDSRVVMNVSLGTQPNCRVFEALACGAALVTDSWNIGMDGVPCWRFGDTPSLERALDDAHAYTERDQEEGLRWARAHSPERQWVRVFDAVRDALQDPGGARQARLAWERDMEEKARTAPRTNDGRPVILI